MRIPCSPTLALVLLAALPCAQAQTIDSFNPMPGSGPIALAIQADGKILIGGQFQTVGVTSRRGVARLNVDGSVDPVFGDPNANGTIEALALQADGKMLVGGDFTQIGGQTRNALARLNADGTLDTSFGDPGLDSTVWTIAVQPDGKVLAGGDFAHVGATARTYVARFTTAGAFDASFADPQLCCLPVRAVALQPDGHVLISGYFSQAGGSTSQSYLARYSSSGVFDPAFPASAPPGPLAGGMMVGPDGSIYVVGGYGTNDSMNLRLVSKLSSAGALVSAFDNLHTDGSANTFVLQPNGKLLIGGNFQQVGDQPRHGLARLNADGSLDSTFADLAFSLDGTHPNGSIFGLAVQADGNVLAAGNFSLVHNQSRQFMARVATGDPATSRLTVQPSGTSVVATWTRSGDGPELAQTPTMMYSTDGVHFTALGPMARVSNGWQATAPYNVHGALFYLQATGTTSGGEQNGSSGQVASNIYFSDTIFEDGFE